MYKNIILFGFRYTGKSTIGKAIATNLNWSFVDIDTEVEKEISDTIFNIVQTEDGWLKFRKVEYKIFLDLASRERVVISCGGGLGVNDAIYNSSTFGEIERDFINCNLHNSLKIILEIDNQILRQRIKNDSYKRPLLSSKKTNNINEIIDENLELYYKRKPLYEKINYDIKIDSSNDKIANAILENKLCCVIGDPVEKSLSPVLHNACYRKINNDSSFVFTKIKFNINTICKIKDITKVLNLKGISVTSPYKERILDYLDEQSTSVKDIIACNTIINKNGKLIGYNTDFIGVQKALEQHCDLKNKRVAIFGSSGGAKSAVFGIMQKTKNITLFNRNQDKNNQFVKKYNIQSQSLSEFEAANFDIIVNATTVGMNSDECILDLHNQSKLSSQHIVFDMVYSPLKTRLLQIAESNGAKIIFGTEMLIYQALEQFELYINHKGSENAMRMAIANLNFENTACIIVQGVGVGDFLCNVKNAKYYNKMIELRVDYIKNLSQNDIKKIAEQVDGLSSIFTLRMVKNGGNFGGNLDEYINILNYAISLKKFAKFK